MLALEQAVTSGHADIVLFLMTEVLTEYIPIAGTEDLYRALLTACRSGFSDVAAILLDYLPRPYQVPFIREAPLLACRRGYSTVVEVFLKKWPELGNTLWFQTMLREAVEGEHQHLINRLLQFAAENCPNPGKVLEECRVMLRDVGTFQSLTASGQIVQRQRLLKNASWQSDKEARVAERLMLRR